MAENVLARHASIEHWSKTVDKVLLLSAVAYFFGEIWFHFHWRLHRLIANIFLPATNFKGTWQQLSITIKHCGMKIVCRLFQSFKRPHTTQTCDCVKWWLDLFWAFQNTLAWHSDFVSGTHIFKWSFLWPINFHSQIQVSMVSWVQQTQCNGFFIGSKKIEITVIVFEWVVFFEMVR